MFFRPSGSQITLLVRFKKDWLLVRIMTAAMVLLVEYERCSKSARKVLTLFLASEHALKRGKEKQVSYCGASFCQARC